MKPMELKNYNHTRIRLAELLFPIVCDTQNEFELIYHPRMKGVFVGDTNKPEWEDKIIVLFDICAPPKFKDFFKKNKYQYKNYYETIDGKYYEILAFVIPPQHRKAIKNLLNNHVEGVSFAYKNHIEQTTSFDSEFYPWSINGRNRPIFKDHIILDLNGVNKKGIQKCIPFCV